MKFDLEKVYSDYINHENTINRKKYDKYKGWFSASSAGSCFKKQFLRAKGKEGTPMDNRVLRLLRLGTIVHKDFEEAIKLHLENLDTKDYKIYSEHRIEIPEINVIGHLDIAVEQHNNLDIYDLKTVASYKWSKQFGWKKNRDTNPSVNYELQLGTYAIGLANETGIEPDRIYLYLAWYNRDNSGMKIKDVPSFWMDNAFEYWTELGELWEGTEGDFTQLIPGSENIPVAKWECKYCEYKDIFCEGIK